MIHFENDTIRLFLLDRLKCFEACAVYGEKTVQKLKLLLSTQLERLNYSQFELCTAQVQSSFVATFKTTNRIIDLDCKSFILNGNMLY